MLKKLLKIGLDFLFPKNCLICEKENSDFLCEQCLKNLSFLEAQCPSCRGKSQLGEFCSQCRKNFYLQGVLIAGDFNDKNLAKLIKFYKYHFIQDLGEPLSLFLYNFLQEKIISSSVASLFNLKSFRKKHFFNNQKKYLILPVPLSKQRQRWRGFNQSEILAEKLSTKLNWPISNQLIRTKHRKAQAKLKAQERKINLLNCYQWRGEDLKNKNIILIDDVYTTGATLNEIARELKKHQAGDIWGLVLAKG